MKSGASRWSSEKREVLEAAQRMALEGLVVGTYGNVSRRIREEDGRELVAITPNARYYDAMGVDDIVIVDMDGETVEGELPTSIEKMLHIGVYRARSKVNAVIHTHPVFSSVLSIAGIEIPPILDDQATNIGGEIKVAEYAVPGSPDLAQKALAALGPRNAALLAHHGALAVGRDMREAFTVCELVEKTAQVYIYAVMLGRVNPLPAEGLAVEQAYFKYLHGEE